MDIFSFLEEANTPKIEKLPWMEDTHMSLVTKEDLPSVIDECIANGKYAIDLETTGLDIRVFHGKTVVSIVGICLATSDTKGWYIPVRHQGFSGNIPWHFVHKELLRLIESDSISIVHNGLYDHEVLQFNGGVPLGEWDDPDRWEDTLAMAYVINSKMKNKGLKHLSDTMLDRKMIELKQLFPEDHKGSLDYSRLDPTWEPVIWYAVSDAMCTYGLYEKLYPQIHERDSDGKNLAIPYKIEKRCAPSVRWMKRARMLVDRKKAEELLRIGQKEYVESIKSIYEAANELLGRDVIPGYIKILFRDFNPEWSIKNQIEVAKGRARLESPDPIGAIEKEAVVTREQVYPFYAMRDDDRIQWVRDKLETNKLKDEVRAVIQTLVTFWPPSRSRDEACNILDHHDIPYNEEGRFIAKYPLVYDVKSAKQLGDMFQELGVPDLIRSKSCAITTGKEAVDKIVEKSVDKFPWMGRVKRFRETEKALSSYILPLLEDSDPSDDSISINYNPYRIDTGRFCTPGSKKPERDGGTRLNMHGMPNQYDSSRPECMNRLRECFISRPGKLMAAFDFGSVELRICANHSGEPKWVDAYFVCSHCGTQYSRGDGSGTPVPPPDFCSNCGRDDIGDLHTLTAISIFGDRRAELKKDWKKLRQKGKFTNFASAYGGGPSAISRTANVDMDEAKFIKKKFDESYAVLKSWWSDQHQFVRRHGFVRTAFNRKCPLPDIYHENKQFVAKAERNSTNAPIQGTSADVTKLAMGLIYLDCKKRGWLDKVHMLVTFHDELVFEIDKDIFAEAYDMIVYNMTRNPVFLRMNWTVPLTAGGEIGYSYAAPYDAVKYLGGKPYKTDKEGNVIKDWPEFIKEAFKGHIANNDYAVPLDEAGRPVVDAVNVNTEKDFMFKIEQDMTVDLVSKIGKAIVASQNVEGEILRLVDSEGNVLNFPEGNIRVDRYTFKENMK